MRMGCPSNKMMPILCGVKLNEAKRKEGGGGWGEERGASAFYFMNWKSNCVERGEGQNPIRPTPFHPVNLGYLTSDILSDIMEIQQRKLSTI